MKQTKTVNSRHLATFYSYLGWTVVEETASDGGETFYNLSVDIKKDNVEQFMLNQNKAEAILKKMNYFSRPFSSYWFNNILLTLLTVVVFYLVALRHDFFTVSEFTWPFIAELLGWTAALYLGLYLLFFLVKFIYHRLQTKKILKLGSSNLSFIN